MEKRVTLPIPKGMQAASPTEKAKQADNPIGGGTPAIRLPNTVRADSYKVAPLNKEVPNQKRSPEEIRKDFETLAAAQQKYAEEQKAPEVEKEEPKEVKSSSEEIVEDLDAYDWERFKKESAEGDFTSPELRKKIEARCSKINIDQLITDGEITQTVPIIPGKLEVTFRTYNSEEDLAVKRLIGDDQGPNKFIWDKFSIMNMALSLHSVNGYPLPTHLDPSGDFSTDAFKNKMKAIMRMPYHMIGLIYTNFAWFDQRVRKQFIEHDLGNG